jgi:predicted ATPase
MPQLTRQGAFRKSLEQHGFLYYNTIAAKQLLAFSRQKKGVAQPFADRRLLIAIFLLARRAERVNIL